MGYPINWKSICTAGFDAQGATDRAYSLLSNTEVPTGSPEVEGQIGEAESDHIVRFFKEVYAPVITRARIEPESARILEIGAGFGRLAYGSLSNITPEIYVATDVFPELINILSANLEKWSKPTTAIGAFILQPADDLYIKKGKFNVIQSHSVLHHVLDYKQAVRSLYEKLDAPGVLIFGEPVVDGYLVLVTLIRLIKMLNISHPVYTFSETLINHLSQMETNLVGRIKNHDNYSFLAKYGHGDKHIFSLYDFMNLASELGARLYIPRENRGLYGLAVGQLALGKDW